MEVEMPTSAPKPYLKPSAKRVLQFQYTPAASTWLWNTRAAAASSVTMQSVCRDPYLLMWATASVRSPTTLTDSILSQYSVAQSASVAALKPPPRTAAAAGQSSSSTPSALQRCAKAGRNCPAAALWTRRVSTELQAEGYCVLASIAMSSALPWSALASMKTWHTPSAWPSTGMSVLRITCCTKSLDPRGMMRSTYCFILSSSAVSSRDVSSATTSGDARDPRSPSLTASTMTRQVCTASLPHLSNTPLPDLIPSDAICTAASGRASKMIPRTPSGTVTRRKTSPLSSSLLIWTWPIGSARLFRFRTPWIASRNLDPPNLRRA
mmetsp:Transcript_41381/g.110737  ORF Transcript_41381/g.110737 Transcript_41381/m.110737 type:complete len:323 (-) Transcript_41381:291-1259(-)